LKGRWSGAVVTGALAARDIETFLKLRFLTGKKRIRGVVLRVNAARQWKGWKVLVLR